MKRKRREAGHQAGVSRSGWAGVGWGGRCGLPPSLPWPRFWLLLPLLYPDRSSLTTRGRRNYLDFLTRAGLPCAFSYSFTRFCSRLWLSLSPSLPCTSHNVKWPWFTDITWLCSVKSVSVACLLHINNFCQYTMIYTLSSLFSTYFILLFLTVLCL